MKKRSGDGGGGGSWLNTYADMVTLLLCFFVLLYAISSVDKAKFEILVKSLNPNYAKQVSQIVTDTSSQDGDFDVQGSMDKPAENAIQNFDDLYYTLVQATKQSGLSDKDVQIKKQDAESSKSSDGKGAAQAQQQGIQSAFITFKDSVFFNGDDSRLTPQGKKILQKFSQILGKANNIIGEVDVLGHTSQGDPKKPNNIRTDFTLSALRSMEVMVFLADNGKLDRYKLVGQFFGQNKAIAGFDTAENRSKNRRVEILILKKGTEKNSILNKYYREFYQGDIRGSNFKIPADSTNSKDNKSDNKQDNKQNNNQSADTTKENNNSQSNASNNTTSSSNENKDNSKDNQGKDAVKPTSSNPEGLAPGNGPNDLFGSTPPKK